MDMIIFASPVLSKYQGFEKRYTTLQPNQDASFNGRVNLPDNELPFYERIEDLEDENFDHIPSLANPRAWYIWFYEHNFPIPDAECSVPVPSPDKWGGLAAGRASSCKIMPKPNNG